MQTAETRHRQDASAPWRAVCRAIWGATGLGAVGCAVAGTWTLAFVAVAAMGLAAMPRAFTWASGIVFPAGLSTGILLYVLAALVLGELAGLYVSVPWWDLALHLVASAVLGIVGMGLAMLPTGGGPPRTAVWLLAVLAFGFAMMVGAMWELLEFSLDALLGTNTQRSGLPDTIGDMAVNLVGATLGAVAGHAHVAHGARWPLAGLLGRFMDANAVIYPERSKRGRGPLAR